MERTASAPPVAASSVIAAIPARWGSCRFPGKPLHRLAGQTMIERVYRRAAAASGLDRIVVLTDDDRIVAEVARFGGEVELTPADCASGTDRIAWAAERWPTESAVINVQGDEPLIDPRAISRVARHLRAAPADSMVTLATAAQAREIDDPNAVKVVVDQRGYALYFSRSPIPHLRHAGIVAPLKHLGLYGYQRPTLLQLAALPPSPLERTESLEQLRALEAGISIRVFLVEASAPGVDTPEDAERVEQLLRDHPD